VRFDDLLTLLRGLDLDDDVRRPPRDNVRAIQHSLSACLADEDFCLDCIELELAALASRPAGGRRASMFVMPDRPLRFEMFYWWPGRVAAAHEHTRWTVTAVFFNSLQVTTYDWDIAFRERRLERKHVFVAPQGKAGHIYDRCIHNPANGTNRDSMSIHIFNASDVPLIENEVGPIPGLGLPSAGSAQHNESFASKRQRQLRVIAQAACQYRSPRAIAILDRILASGDAETQARVERLRWRASRARAAMEATVQRSP
jgi:hypothetical protein